MSNFMIRSVHGSTYTYGSLLLATGSRALYTSWQVYSEILVIPIRPLHCTIAVEPAIPFPQLLMYRLSCDVIPIVGSKVENPIP